MNQPSIAKFSTVALALLTLPAVSFAGTTAPAKETVVEKVKESCISGSIGIDVISQYIARGIVQENQGAIIQPYADWHFKVCESDSFLTKLTVDLAFWNSFHSRGTGASPGSTTRKWYESDFVAGFSFHFGDVVLSPYYQAYMSPSDAFETAHDVGIRLAYYGTIGNFTLSPYALVQWDIDGTSGNGGDEGVYYEVGISPGYHIGPFAVSVPIKAGFGSSGYYFGDENFGYASIGVTAEYGLTFIPECLGDWAVRGYATWYYLGSGTEGHAVPAIRDEEDNEWSFGGGLVVKF